MGKTVQGPSRALLQLDVSEIRAPYSFSSFEFQISRRVNVFEWHYHVPVWSQASVLWCWLARLDLVSGYILCYSSVITEFSFNRRHVLSVQQPNLLSLCLNVLMVLSSSDHEQSDKRYIPTACLLYGCNSFHHVYCMIKLSEENRGSLHVVPYYFRFIALEDRI